ncbi:bifunctional 2-keto-4-hydroxyglutarate aldolase/2-keto-3-deoxy-6-phosphogluconate aldolase [Paenibacillus thermoaerophilus]|uniref:Bifunctional 2-keto-4-hydroxyglutarate aldolase/2-keto-3-deoxy-6-phosphogluconate aldolase n=1 Tax=Paenibacillus thermoaerophilus TaxID=1215385 RepID=A0ABW2V6C6_9BACL|nr:bifunctional 2-keto-4-hydroxyglutarate aldolase/2-keto-3-deoxy-6-phosphogluconate aldolase [Paenibacillus thermoaerophilus]TMV13923.1 bifunctional 4-hydroxy-2-oxoglutarate aldolase/2-dehydro-3-deoxy-phosphogluconate aldolase [Paenibacillus thermoaerophilus]
MKKLKLIQQICEDGVVAVLRGRSADEVVEMAEQSIAGGIKVIEVTMTTPGALGAIERLAAKYSSDAKGKDDSRYAVIGAGTVLDPETARAAILSGSEFVVGPSFNPDTVKLCNRYRIPVMPGVMTVQEIQSALDLGVDICKLFPGNLFSPGMIKAIKGPLPQANLMPTGGVSLDNLAQWIKAGAVAVGIGSDLTNDAVKTGDFSLIAKRAAQYMEVYRSARSGS